MSTLRIYDTKGNAYSPDGTATGSNEQVKDLFYGGVRLAIRSDHRSEISLFFRARETRNARTEQFYAVYSADDSSSPLRDLITDLTTRVESEWGYSIDDSSEEMQVFRELKRMNTAVPGDDTERDILSELISSRQSVAVGVQDERNAIGLLSEYLGQYDRGAIADSEDADVLSTFDFVVTPTGARGITPLGETEARWESTSQSLRDKHIKQEISSIRDSVDTLSREYGLSNGEIRKRVESSVPALKSPTTNSNLGSTTTQSDDDKLLSPEIGLYVAVGAAILLVLFAGVMIVPDLLGGGPAPADPGNETGNATPQVTVAGVLVDNETDEQINSSIENVSVILRNENGSLSTTDEPEYNFTVNETLVTNATLVADADGYNEGQRDVSGEDTAGEIHLDPVEPESESTTDQDPPERSRVEGTVRNSNTSEAVSGVTVTLANGTFEEQQTTGSEGEYAFENVSYGEYTLSANATGYVGQTNETSVSSSEPQVEDISLEPKASMSLFFVSSEGSTGNAALVRLIDTDADPEEVIDNSSSDGDGYYNISNLEAGSYRVEFSKEGFEDKNATISLDPGQSYYEEIRIVLSETVLSDLHTDPGRSRNDLKRATYRAA